MRTSFFFLCFLAASIFLSAQSPWTTKYTNYKNRFNTKFCSVGSNAGQSIPSSAHKSVISAGDSINHWGDATIELGWYVGVLSTEYEIKRMNGEDFSQTISDLYYALHAINRLDSVAEIYYGGTSSLNGFFVRDDVSPSMIPATNLTQPLMFNSDNCLVSNFACGSSYCLPITSLCIGSLNNEESQDQFYHLLMGLSLCAKYCNVTHGGLNLSLEAKAITNRMITYIKSNAWIIKNPVTGNNVSRGENTTSYCYGIANAGLNVTGINYSDAVTTSFTSLTSWNVFPTITFPIGSSLTSDNVHMFLATACVANDTRASVDAYATTYGMPIYPLIRQILYNGPNTINDTVYVNLINKADINGPYYYSPTAKSTGGTWLSENLFVWPERSKASAIGTNTLSFSFGEYSGLDFMLLRNLMVIKNLTVNINEFNLSNNEFIVYPNPNSGSFQVQTNLKGNFIIYDLFGKLVFQAPVNSLTSSIEISSLPEGIYFYKLESKKELLKAGKLVIVK